MKKIWEKKGDGTRAENSTASFVESFTVGNDFLLDQKLLPYDVQASIVHAESLRAAGLLTDEEAAQLVSGLDEIHSLWEQDAFPILQEQEDGHTAIEAWLTEKFGETGGKIHTGRSRNDQVLTAMRLYELDKLDEVHKFIKETTHALLDFAESAAGVPMPGYTHTRKAMLSGVSQWACGYAELLAAQLGMLEACKTLISRSPLGTAAGFGSGIDLDREAQAASLGFETLLQCATSAQLSRGWMEQQLVGTLAACSALLSRMAADIIRYSSESYGYFVLDAVVCTGSSIMPQKKNPDLAELLRGRHNLVMAQQFTLQQLTQNLESGYHRDLQLGKEPVMLAFEHLTMMLKAANVLISHTKPDIEKLEQACTPELFAAEYANMLVKQEGISFREAYKRAAEEAGSEKNTFTATQMMKSYTQPGSPGKPGIEAIRKIIAT